MSVTLIGAGPGDIGLLTLKAADRLKSADVVLYDRLISREILDLIPEAAEKIDVGKNVGNHPVPQKEINQILAGKAAQGLNVVRLKGGDPFVFGRGAEELELLAGHGIPFEVVPGISSSIAAGEYAGIPVTHRDYSSSVHIITGHAKENGALDIDFEALVRLDATLVFMMSVAALPQICKGLLKAGINESTPAAIIENATTASQRKFIGVVKDLPEIAVKNAVVSPSVIIVGKVCGLSEKLDWFGKGMLSGKKIIVTRARTSPSGLSARLRELGARVLEIPCIKIVPSVSGNTALKEAISSIKAYGWLVFTSAAGVDLFFEYLLENRIDIRLLHHLRLAAVGSETAKSITIRGLLVDYVPENYSGEDLAKGLVKLVSPNERLLLLRAKIADADMDEILGNAGIGFDDISLYDTVYEADNASEYIMTGTPPDYVTFTSSSTVDGFAKAFPELDLTKISGVCIGEKTAKTARGYGINVTVSKKATIESMIEAIKELAENDNPTAQA